LVITIENFDSGMDIIQGFPDLRRHFFELR
jgi:hypothetical protein